MSSTTRNNTFFARPLYPMRLLGTLMCIVAGALYVERHDTLHVWYLLILILALVYPHVSRYLAGQLERRRNLELRTSLVDAFLIGSTIYIVGFSGIPTLSLMTIALANGMALGGVSFMMLSVLTLSIGIALPSALYGINYAPSDYLPLSLLAGAMLMVYFIMFALVAYRRSILLQTSRRLQRQQTNVVEIEKQKSENLLRALLPLAIAEELKDTKAVAARRHDSATVIIAVIPEFSSVGAEIESEELLGEINHCFRAFDQIVERNRVESLRITMDSFLAVAGAPLTSSTHAVDAVNAALEMRDFVDQHNQARFAAGKSDLGFAFVVHTGPLVSGLIETRKFTFDVLGDAVDGALVMAHAAQADTLMVSQSTMAQLEDSVSAQKIDTLQRSTGVAIERYLVSARAARVP